MSARVNDILKIATESYENPEKGTNNCVLEWIELGKRRGQV